MNKRNLRRASLGAICSAAATLCVVPVSLHAAPAAHAGKTRTYYVAADEVNWDYAPSGRDEAMGMPFDAIAKGFTETSANHIGRVYKKAVYHEYTDATFTTIKPREAKDSYLGILGPILYAEVGDTIKVVFKNNATHPYGMHPHGVLYEKDSEGADYNGGTGDMEDRGACIAPGATHTYTWQVPERAGPGPADPSSLFWLYHSHCDELRDVASGLFGGLVITRRGMARPDGTPKDVDEEFVTIFIAINENESWYLDDNIKAHIADPSKLNRYEFKPVTRGRGSSAPLPVQGFFETNVKWSINGYIYGNVPMMVMKRAIMCAGTWPRSATSTTRHTPHWHGNTVLVARPADGCSGIDIRADDHGRHGA